MGGKVRWLTPKEIARTEARQKLKTELERFKAEQKVELEAFKKKQKAELAAIRGRMKDQLLDKKYTLESQLGLRRMTDPFEDDSPRKRKPRT